MAESATEKGHEPGSRRWNRSSAPARLDPQAGLRRSARSVLMEQINRRGRLGALRCSRRAPDSRRCSSRANLFFCFRPSPNPFQMPWLNDGGRPPPPSGRGDPRRGGIPELSSTLAVTAFSSDAGDASALSALPAKSSDRERAIVPPDGPCRGAHFFDRYFSLRTACSPSFEHLYDSALGPHDSGTGGPVSWWPEVRCRICR